MGLPKAGIPASIPLSLQHAPVRDFDFGIVDPYISQSCLWVQSIVDNIWTSSLTGTLLQIAIADAQLKMGVTSDLSDYPSWNPLQWLTTASWIRSCIEFVWKHGVRISPLGTTLPPPQIRDKGIIEAFTMFIDNTMTLQCLN